MLSDANDPRKLACELCGRREDAYSIQEQCGFNLCLSCDGKYTDEELKEKANENI